MGVVDTEAVMDTALAVVAAAAAVAAVALDAGKAERPVGLFSELWLL